MNSSRSPVVWCMVIAGIVLLGALLILPPYSNRYSCVTQLWLGRFTGIWLHHRPEHFTGTFRLWDERGAPTCEEHYVEGRRTGVWVEYGPKGVIRSSCTYSNDEPWEGLCHFWEGKSWVGEYRAGKPWNGRLPHRTEDGEIGWKSYIDGVEVSDEEYKRRLRIDPKSTVIGIHHTR